MTEEQFLEIIEVLDRIARALEGSGLSPPNKNASWRNDPASDKQKSFMPKQGIPFSEPLTKGRASDLIDGYFRNKKRD